MYPGLLWCFEAARNTYPSHVSLLTHPPICARAPLAPKSCTQYIYPLNLLLAPLSTTTNGVQGRIGILKVHARDKELEDDIDFHKVARATAGSTGAELMNLMNQSAIVTVRQGRKKITQADIFEVCCCSCSPPNTQNTAQQ